MEDAMKAQPAAQYEGLERCRNNVEAQREGAKSQHEAVESKAIPDANPSGAAAGPNDGDSQEQAAEVDSFDPIAYVTAACGNAEKAKDALAATAKKEQHPIDWAEAAVLHLAVASECEQEKQALEAAMAVSLQESEGRKADVKPLQQWENAELLERFSSSSILPQVTEACISGRPLETPSRNALIEVLDFERSNLRWYPVPSTRTFFTRMAQEAITSVSEDKQRQEGGQAKRHRNESGYEASSLRPLRKQRSESMTDKAAEIANGCDPTHRQSAERKADKGQAGPSKDGSRDEDVGDDPELQRISERLLQMVSVAKVEIYQMPAEGQQVPSIFLDTGDGDTGDGPGGDSDCEVVACNEPSVGEAPLQIDLADYGL